MSGLLCKRASIVALAFGVFTAGAALAQGSSVSGVTVTAPRVIGREASGIPIEEVSLSAVVRYSDLDMKTSQGAAALDKRVKETADSICRKLEADYPVGRPNAVACAKEAVAKAAAQVRAAKGAG